MSRSTIAIVGGGFCGALAAIRLLAGGASMPPGSRVTLVEPAGPGQGLAYRAGPAYWQLNVPADRMSAFAERPSDFLDWARERHPAVRADEFLPRGWYGDYLAARLEEACLRSASRPAFEQLRTRAIDLRPADRGATLTLVDGTTILAERVLLALGNSPIATPVPGLAAGATITDPWNPEWVARLPDRSPRVLLIGTGLSMIDIALHLAAVRPEADMLAVSRHGLLPLPHADSPANHPRAAFAAATELAQGPLHRRIRRFREFVESQAGSGGDWRVTLQSVREAMPTLWQSMPRTQRAQFLRHLRSQWDVHRHRAPRETLARIDGFRRADRLRVEAGRLLAAGRAGNAIAVTWRPRGETQTVDERVHAVVNLTGSDSSVRRSTCPLVQSLLAQGLCRPDEFGLGWGADEEGRLLAADGSASRSIFYAGPLLRAQWWEATAVPELRKHVDRTVNAMAASLANDTARF